MAKIKSDILVLLNKYLQLVNERGINVNSAYLYGSFANNSENDFSDIDFAIFSEDFEGVLAKDIDKLLGISRKVDSRISVMTLNQESLDSFFVQNEIIKKGIKII